MNKKCYEATAVTFALLMPLLMLLVTAIVEVAIGDSRYVQMVEIALCIVWVIGKFRYEKSVPKEKVRAYNLFYGIAMIIADICLAFLVKWYTKESYGVFTNDDSYIGGVQWVNYLMIVYYAQAFWVAIRAVISILKAKSSNEDIKT